MKMATYVVSDIHGEIERFKKLLKDINFSKKDVMYVLGDVIDRGPGGIDILRLVKRTKNMVFLLGNHEFMMERYFSETATDDEKKLWNGKGNATTLRQLGRLKARKRRELLRYIRESESHAEIQVAGKSYYLTHGFPHLLREEEVWGRPDEDTISDLTGKRVIIGHTPVVCIGRDNRATNEYLNDLDKRNQKLKIFHADGYIDIDCGCGHDIKSKALACLRLDDMEEFYI